MKYKQYIIPTFIISLLYLIYNGIIQKLIFHLLFLPSLIFNSLITIENYNDVSKDDLLLLSKKWTCYGTFIIFKYILSLLFVILPFISLYNLLEFIMFIWILFNNAYINVIYDSYIDKFYKNNNEVLLMIYNYVIDYFIIIKEKINNICNVNVVSIFNIIKKYILMFIKNNFI